jgi:hypothetical protein
MLFGWENNSTKDKADHGGLLTKEERRIFAEWIDLGAHWDNEYFTAE